MAKKHIVWTDTAIRQRRLILLYWTKRNQSPEYAIKLVKIISARLKVIAQNPEAFRETEFPITRESAIGHFSLYYKVTYSAIIVTAFWDNRQDPKKFLKLLKS